jgi:hypothetical protein
VLTGSGLGDNPRLPHTQGQEGLAHGVVDFVSPGGRQSFLFDVNLRTAQLLAGVFRVEERSGPTDEFLLHTKEIFVKAFIGHGLDICLFQVVQGSPQHLGNIAPAILAKIIVIYLLHD